MAFTAAQFSDASKAGAAVMAGTTGTTARQLRLGEEIAMIQFYLKDPRPPRLRRRRPVIRGLGWLRLWHRPGQGPAIHPGRRSGSQRH